MLQMNHQETYFFSQKKLGISCWCKSIHPPSVDVSLPLRTRWTPLLKHQRIDTVVPREGPPPNVSLEGKFLEGRAQDI